MIYVSGIMGFLTSLDEIFNARLKCEGFSVDMRSTWINSDRKIDDLP